MSLSTITHRDHGSCMPPSLEHAIVSDAMTPGIVSCEANATLTHVARMMALHRVHCIAVMGLAEHNSGEPQVWGIVSDQALVRGGVRTGVERIAGGLADEPVVTVEPMMALREAAERMLAGGASHAVVVNPATDRPVGVLSTLDIAEVLAWGEA